MKALLEQLDFPVQLINARFIKPLDESLLNELYEHNQEIIVYETDLMIGSLGSQIAHYYSKHQHPMTIHYIGIDDHYTPQGDIVSLQKKENIDIDALEKKIKEIFNEKGKN